MVAVGTYLMTDLVKRVERMRASGVISHMTEKASRSTSARRLQMSSVSGLGSMSILLCTRYVVVALHTIYAATHVFSEPYSNAYSSALYSRMYEVKA